LRFKITLLLILINQLALLANRIDPLAYRQAMAYARPDTIAAPDSAKNKKGAIEDPVFTNADDSIVYSLDGKIAYLYGNGVVTYQNLELKANYIEFDMDTKQVYAS